MKKTGRIHSKRLPGPNQIDPTRTGTIVKQFLRLLQSRINYVKKKVVELVGTQDAFGLKILQNDVYSAVTSREKLEAFKAFLTKEFERTMFSEKRFTDSIDALIEQGFKKGAGRAFDDANQSFTIPDKKDKTSKFYQGTKQQFLDSAFAQPVARERVELIAARVLTDLKGVTSAMETQMTRVLAGGLTQGLSPRDVARQMANQVEGLTRTRANVIARTETITAHAEGQLTAFEELGVTEIGVAAEWSTAGDTRVCDLCGPMEGVVLKVTEAHGLIPRHPNCRCMWIPANVREREFTGVRSKKSIDRAIRKSVLGELPQKTKNLRGRTVSSQMQESRWAGTRVVVSKDRPLGVVRQGKQYRVGEVIYKVADPLIQLSNLFPKVAGAVVEGAGLPPNIAKIASVAATLGDYSVPGIPAGSLTIAVLAHLRNPLASFNATKKGIKNLIKFVKRKYRGVRAGAGLRG